MSFIDKATGSPDVFEAEVLDAFMQVGTGTNQFCVLAGAAYLAQVVKRFASFQDPSHFKTVGTASLIINTSHGRVYCQAVNDRYTEAWPLPWIIGADRKSTMPPNSIPTPNQMSETIARDLAAFYALYVPDSQKPPSEMIARYAKPWPGITERLGGGDPLLKIVAQTHHMVATDVMVAVKQGRVSPVQQFCLDYPWKAPNRVTNYLAPTAGKPAQAPVVSKPVKPVGPKEKTLADVMGERRKQSRWGG